jgi:hypothetical protein
MPRGILEMLGSVSILMIAIPPAYAGLELLVRGNVAVGVGLLAVSLGMVVADQYVTTPGDLPVIVADKLVGAVARPPDDEE